VLAVALVFGALVAGVTGTALGLVRALAAEARAERDRDDALAAKTAESAALVKAIEAKNEETKAKGVALNAQIEEWKAKVAALRAANEARDETAIAKLANDFIRNNLFVVPRQGALGTTGVNLLSLLDRAAREVDRAKVYYDMNPLLEAHIRMILADGYRSLSSGKAPPNYLRAYELFRQERGEDHDDTQTAVLSVARLYSGGENGDERLRKCLEVRVRTHGEDDRATKIMVELARVCARLKNRDEAEALFVRALDARRRVSPETTGADVDLLHEVAVFYQSQNKDAGAEPLYARIWEYWRSLGEGPLVGRTHSALTNLCGAYRAQGKFAEMEAALRTHLAALEANNRKDSWQYHHARSLLGEALVGRKSFADAEPLLTDSFKELKLANQNRPMIVPRAPKTADEYEAMVERLRSAPQVTPAHVGEATARLVALYEAWEKPERATPWRAERAKYPGTTGPPVPPN
jgi:tetratricopeptide (TPR) repeat protein